MIRNVLARCEEKGMGVGMDTPVWTCCESVGIFLFCPQNAMCSK